jgi:oligoribonuclease (3'-5' exoribonuclease)
MKIFLDMEMTGLHQKTTLISLGCVTEAGHQFYAEATDYDRDQVNPWLEKNVIAHLELINRPGKPLPIYNHIDDGQLVTVLGTREQIAVLFRDWISQFHQVEIWGDVLPYDWILFCELFEASIDTAERLPRNVYYIPFDIATLMKVKGVDPDISREEFSGLQGHVKHNALDDANVIKTCYEKLIAM